MNKQTHPSRPFLTALKVLIVLSPLPFGCVGKIFAPLFFLALTIVSLMALEQNRPHGDMLHETWIRRFFYLFLAFLGLQLIPLPLFLLKLISPAAVNILAELKDQLPSFHPVSLVPFETFLYGCKFLAFALFFLVMVRVPLKKQEIVSLLNVVVISAVFQVVFGFLKYLGGNRYFYLFFYPIDESDSLRGRLTGTLGNSDHFAFFLEMVLPLALALFFVNLRFFERRRSARNTIDAILNEKKALIFYFVAAVILGSGIFLTGSRGGVGTLALSLMLFVLFSAYLRFSSEVRRKLKIIFFVILGIVIFFGVHNTVERFLRTRVEKELRFSVRWPATIGMISDFPLLGTGFGTYRYAYYFYDREGGDRWTTHAHNDYLETVSDGGVLGGALLLSLIAAIVTAIYRKWWQRRHPEIKMLGLGIMVSLFAISFHSIFDFSLRIPANMFLLVLILALGLKTAAAARGGQERSDGR